MGGGARREPTPEVLPGEPAAVVAARAGLLALYVALVPRVDRGVGDGVGGVDLPCLERRYGLWMISCRISFSGSGKGEQGNASGIAPPQAMAIPRSAARRRLRSVARGGAESRRILQPDSEGWQRCRF